MIKKIGQKSRSPKFKFNNLYFEKKLCHLSLSDPLIYESCHRILHLEMLFSYICL